MGKTRRPKGEGSITKLPNGNYKMTISVGTGIDGKQKRRSVTAKTKTELMKRVSELRLSIGQQKAIETPIYFKELVDIFLETKKEEVRSNTWRTYLYAQNILFKPLYDFKVSKITPKMIDAVLDALKLKSSTIKGLKVRLSTLFLWAVKQGYIDKSPMVATKTRPLGIKKVNRVVIPSDEGMKKLLEFAKSYDETHKHQMHYYPLFLLAVSTGMRMGEILGLTRSDVDLNAGTIDINKQKIRGQKVAPLKTPSSYRRIYVDQEVLKVVLEDTNGNLWNNIPYTSVYADWGRFKAVCPCLPDGFTFHCFRHYHATHLLVAGIDIKEVSKRLGHNNISTTLDLYAHWVPEMDRRAAGAIGNQFIL
ncbi:MAG: site-specific integrase [Acidaminococcus intestini]|uniref:Site-specific integrase n=1 Tax=Acidaminococcus intestini TaxID=187327 RepID=A0A943EG89_9FIRM|nr:site-specific integrase [Acidaminococcus intestini]